MKNTIVDIADFRTKLADGDAAGVTVRFAPTAELQIIGDERVMKFVFSDGSVDRYGDTIDARGWVLDSFNANPVALFGHDANTVENVIGKARNVRIEGQRLVGEIEFMEASVNPKAEAVYQMLKGGFLNAVSVGFQPIEWDLSKDKSRPQGINFKKQELLEISVVPIPALPTALVQACAAGIDVDRLGLIEQEAASLDINKRRSALQVRKMLNRRTKSLSDLAFFACILSDLGYLTNWSQWEAEMEGDGSNVPNMLVEILFDMADAFSAMSAEELSEFMADFVSEPDIAGFDTGELAYVAEGKSVQARSFRAGCMKMAAFKAGKLERAGRVLSAENQKRLRDAHTQMSAACEIVKGVADSADEPEAAADENSVIVLGDQKTARDRRERLARARKAQAAAL